jgi:hypothetical protein
MKELLEVASQVSTPLALGGLIAAILFLTLRQFIAKGVFPKLTRAVGSKVVIFIITGLFVLAFAAMVLGFVGYMNAGRPGESQSPPQEYAGQVTDTSGRPVYGAVVLIRDESGNVQQTRTDSVGKYRYHVKAATKSARFTVSAEHYERYERDVPPEQTGREPFILTPASPKPTPAATPAPTPPERPARAGSPKGNTAATPKPPPCSAKDKLLGKC